MRMRLWSWLERRGHYDLHPIDNRLWGLLAASCRVLPHRWVADSHSPALDHFTPQAAMRWTCLYCDSQRDTYPHAENGGSR